ncbi:MAG TPA: CPBP family intramembrane glutamic endopeptidase [Terriglobales bacterium]|nr:CPBP family intramembrane glutamic endopeptidase [Terriglobales bacterium]
MSLWFSSPEQRDFAGLRAGWRLAVFGFILVGIPDLLSGGVGKLAPSSPALLVITPGAVAMGEGFALLWVAIATLAMTLLEQRPLGTYGLPARGALRRNFWEGALWGAGSLTALLLLIGASGDLRLGLGARPGMETLRYGLEWGLAFLLVALFEEFRYRGYALFTLRAGVGFWPAAMLLSLAFGAVHLRNPGETPLGVTSAGLLGFFFCFTWWRTGDLWFAVGMHAAWDFCQSFVYGVPDSGLLSHGRLLQPHFQGSSWITGGTVGPEGSVWVLVVVAMLWALFAKLHPQAPASAAMPSQRSTASSAA